MEKANLNRRIKRLKKLRDIWHTSRLEVDRKAMWAYAKKVDKKLDLKESHLMQEECGLNLVADECVCENCRARWCDPMDCW